MVTALVCLSRNQIFLAYRIRPVRESRQVLRALWICGKPPNVDKLWKNDKTVKQ